MSMSNRRRTRLSNGLRSYLRGLARRRSSGVVTADDAHTYLGRNGLDEGKVRTRLSFINSVLMSGAFAPVGSTYSNRPVAKRRAITQWTSTN